MGARLMASILALIHSFAILPIFLNFMNERELSIAIGINPVYIFVLSIISLAMERWQRAPHPDAQKKKIALSVGMFMLSVGLLMFDKFNPIGANGWALMASAVCICLVVQFMFEIIVEHVVKE